MDVYSIWSLSFTTTNYGNGVAIAIASTASEAFNILKAQGTLNHNPEEYQLLGSRVVGRSTITEATLVEEELGGYREIVVTKQSAASNIMIVNVTYDDNLSQYTANKTFAEMKSALLAGKTVMCQLDTDLYANNYADFVFDDPDDEFISFTIALTYPSDLPSVSIKVISTLNVYGNNTWEALDDDSSIIRDAWIINESDDIETVAYKVLFSAIYGNPLYLARENGIANSIPLLYPLTGTSGTYPNFTPVFTLVNNGTITTATYNSSTESWTYTETTISGGDNKEDKSNKVTSLSSSSTNTQYPSAKCVYDELVDKQDTLVSGTSIKTINNVSLLGSGNIDIQGESGGSDLFLITATVNWGTKTITSVNKTDSEIQTAFNSGKRIEIAAPNYVDNKTLTFRLNWKLEYSNYLYLGFNTVDYFVTNNNIVFVPYEIEYNYNSSTSTSTWTLVANINYGVEIKDNLVTSISSSSTDTQYPSAKAVYTAIQESGGGSVPSEYLKSASVNGNTLTLTKKDNTTVVFTPTGGGSDNTFIITLTINGSTISSNKTYQEIVSAYNSKKVIVAYLSTFVMSLTYVMYYGENPYMFRFLTVGTSDNINGITSCSLVHTDSADTWIFNTADLELSDNKVTELSSSSTNTQYPSAKCVYDAIQAGGGSEPAAYIKSASTSGNTLTLTNKDNSTVVFSPTGGGGVTSVNGNTGAVTITTGNIENTGGYITNAALGNYRTSQAQDTIDAGKQDTISDLSTIRSGAALGATALQSVPNTYRTSAAQDAIDTDMLNGYKIRVVSSLPSSPATNTIYLIYGS